MPSATVADPGAGPRLQDLRIAAALKVGRQREQDISPGPPADAPAEVGVVEQVIEGLDPRPDTFGQHSVLAGTDHLS